MWHLRDLHVRAILSLRVAGRRSAARHLPRLFWTGSTTSAVDLPSFVAIYFLPCPGPVLPCPYNSS